MLCEKCYRITNGILCPFSADHKAEVPGWKIEDVREISTGDIRFNVVECPLYVNDYDAEGVYKALKEKEFTEEEIFRRLVSLFYRKRTYLSRNRGEIDK